MWDCSPSGEIITKEFGLVKKQLLEPRGKDRSSMCMLSLLGVLDFVSDWRNEEKTCN